MEEEDDNNNSSSSGGRSGGKGRGEGVVFLKTRILLTLSIKFLNNSLSILLWAEVKLIVLWGFKALKIKKWPFYGKPAIILINNRKSKQWSYK